MYIIDKLYHAFLWFWGFLPGEHITDMLRRQKQRLGIRWWFMVGGSCATGAGFILWLILHVIGIC